MKTVVKAPLTILMVVGVLLCMGCDTNEADAQRFEGPAVSLGQGTARAFVQMSDAGAPDAIGIVFDEAALQGLPPSMAGHENMHVLQLPSEVRTSDFPFDHISFDWNPQGHEPEGLFTVPHFDLHFYMVPEADRMTWLPSNPDFASKGARQPDAKYIPQGFFSPPDNAPVPMMGLHWLDSEDPTYAPGGPAFTEVFIWGSYDGQIIFPEPMITKAFLETKPNHSETLAQPQAFARTGYYPTRYTVRHDAAKKHYVVALEGLTRRTAS